MSAPEQTTKPLSAEELQQLATERTSDRWNRLLNAITEVFIADAQSNMQGCGEEFGEVVGELLNRADDQGRADMSSKIAAVEHFPSEVIKRLARDVYDVAAPILEKSPLLSDSELIAIANEVIEDHRVSISRRKHLGRRLTETLFKLGDAPVLHEMAGNPGAVFSDAVYRKVVEKAKKDKALQEKLVNRSDLSQTFAIQLTPFLSAELKEQLKSSNPPAEESGLLSSLAEVMGSESGKADKKKDRTEDIQEIVREVEAGARSIDEAVAYEADSTNFNDLCLLLSGLAKLPIGQIRSAMLNVNGTPIATVCKALGLSQDTFDAVSHVRCEEMRLPATDLITQLDAYSTMDVDGAKRTLSMLQSKAGATKAAS